MPDSSKTSERFDEARADSEATGPASESSDSTAARPTDIAEKSQDSGKRSNESLQAWRSAPSQMQVDRLPAPRSLGPGRAAVAAGALSAVLFAMGAAPDITWLDSSELATAAFGLGIAHPPGHPLPSMLGHLLMTWIPLGSIAFRCSLASALAMGLAVGSVIWVFSWLMETVWAAWSDHGLVRPTTGQRIWLALLAAGLLAATSAVWIQAVRVEVYALQAGLTLLSVALLGRWLENPRPGHLGASALAAGLALSNHHMQALALVLPVGLLVGVLNRRQWRRIVLWAAFVGLGLLVWLYLPVRAAKEPLINWGHPDSFDRIWWVLSTKLYYKTATRSITSGMGLHLAQILAFLAEQISPLWLLSASMGLYLILRRRASAASGLLLIGIAGCSAVTSALSGFDAGNPDSAAYLLAALASLAVSALVPLGLVMALPGVAKRKWAGWALVSLATAGVLWLAWSHRREDLAFAGSWSASDEAFALAESLPPRSLLLTGYHETTFLLWYATTAEGARPDVCLVFRHHLNLPGRFNQLRKTCPVLATIWKDGRLDPEALLKLDRPVLVELDDHPQDPFPESLLPRLVPRGAFALLGNEPSRSVGPSRRPATRGLERAVNANPSPTDRGLRRFLLWHAYQQAVLWWRLGRCNRARRPWLRAWKLAPQDPLLGDLARRCRFALPSPQAGP